MAAASGSLVLIKVGDGGDPEQFITIGGLRTSEVDINNQLIDVSNVESGAWRLMVSGMGFMSARITGKGVFVDSAAEESVRSDAFENVVRNYRFVFSNSDRVEGKFRISRYQRTGDHNDAEHYAIILDSAGPLNFTAG